MKLILLSAKMNILESIWTLFGKFRSKPNEGSRKRRGDELSGPHDNKIRCVDGSGFSGETNSRLNRDPDKWINQNEVEFQHTQFRSGPVHLSKWNQNGKENFLQLNLPSISYLRTTTMDGNHKSSKNDSDNVQVLEVHNQRTSSFKRVKETSKFSGASYCNVASRSCPDPDIVEIPPPTQKNVRKSVDIVKVITPQPIKKGDSDIQIVKDCSSSWKSGRYNQDLYLSRRPFKVLEASTSAIASSTPIMMSNRRPVLDSPEQPEIQILQSCMPNGLGASHYRSQSSILSSDSNSSRYQSTLSQMKHAEEKKLYQSMVQSCCKERPLPQRKLLSVNRPKSFDSNEGQAVALSSSQMLRRSLRSPISSRQSTGVNLAPSQCQPTSSERISIPVDKKHENEPSTSASRCLSDDAELQCLGQYAIPTTNQPLYGNDVASEILSKYKAMEAIRQQEIEKKVQETKALEERRKLAVTEHHHKWLEIISQDMKNYLRVVEEGKESEDAEVPTLPELTEEMQLEIDKALGSRPDQVLVSAFNLTIKGRDMSTLRPLAWLNDEVINFYMNLLIERGKSDNYPSVYAFNTFFYPKLDQNGYDSLKRWTRKVDVFAHDFLLVPVHRGMHWCMAIIDMKEKVVRYYDSMNGRYQRCLDLLLTYLQKESLDKKKQAFDTSGWEKEHAEDIPQQNNGSDCGMFACMYAEYISRGAPITFTQDDMPYFRRKVVYEILKVKLLC